MMKTIVVVSALITQNKTGRVLMALRHESQELPSRWELPGGKVEEGETEREALVRELQEELGVEATVRELVSVTSFTWNNRCLMLLYSCSIENSIPKSLESRELRWVDFVYARRYLPMLPTQFNWYPDIINLPDVSMNLCGSNSHPSLRGTKNSKCELCGNSKFGSIEFYGFWKCAKCGFSGHNNELVANQW